MRFVFCHPRMQGKVTDKPLTAADKKGAPNAEAIALLAQSLRDPKTFLAAVQRLMLSAAKARTDAEIERIKAASRLDVETHKAEMRMRVKAKALELEREEAKRRKEEESEEEAIAIERRSIEQLRSIAAAFRGEA